jgi:ketosteroid isomerase-like protein
MEANPLPGRDHMKLLRSRTALIVLLCLLSYPAAFATPGQDAKDRAALEQTTQAIRAAFARGDVAGVMAYHHPDVIKALAYHTYQNGADAVAAALRGTFQQYNVEFLEDKTEYLLIRGNTAIEEDLFTIRNTPKSGGAPQIFKGRTMVVFVRYPKSPTGWACIREMIQPATD